MKKGAKEQLRCKKRDSKKGRQKEHNKTTLKAANLERRNSNRKRDDGKEGDREAGSKPTPRKNGHPNDQATTH